jgi:hypothetical protein
MYELHAIPAKKSGSTNRAGMDNAVYNAQVVTQLYDRVHTRGQLAHLWATLTRRSRALTPLASVEVNHNIRARHAIGVQPVPIAKIGGTEGRSGGFDCAFYPLQTHTANRWKSVATAWLEGVTLPPVLLIQVGDSYFVRDGHHRISVLKTFGQEFIEANVVWWEVAESPAYALANGIHQLESAPVPCGCA